MVILKPIMEFEKTLTKTEKLIMRYLLEHSDFKKGLVTMSTKEFMEKHGITRSNFYSELRTVLKRMVVKQVMLDGKSVPFLERIESKIENPNLKRGFISLHLGKEVVALHTQHKYHKVKVQYVKTDKTYAHKHTSALDLVLKSNTNFRTKGMTTLTETTLRTALGMENKYKSSKAFTARVIKVAARELGLAVTVSKKDGKTLYLFIKEHLEEKQDSRLVEVESRSYELKLNTAVKIVQEKHIEFYRAINKDPKIEVLDWINADDFLIAEKSRLEIVQEKSGDNSYKSEIYAYYTAITEYFVLKMITTEEVSPLLGVS